MGREETSEDRLRAAQSRELAEFRRASEIAKRPTKKAVSEELSHTWTPRGVKSWWERPRYQLNGRTPAMAWADGDRELVWWLAYSNHEMMGT